jgi:DNA uptake protein ComE-like DNA-binding protein
MIRALRALALVAALPLLASAQVGKNSFVDPNRASEADLAALPGMNAALAKAVVAGRPHLSMLAVDSLLGKTLTREQRAALHEKLWLHINLNKTAREEIQLIPRSGNRVLREFKEYRPYKSMEQFRREMGKYWDAKEVSRLERYVVIGQ